MGGKARENTASQNLGLAGLYTDQNSFDAKKDEHVSSGGG
jgi:hypothetical protein